MLSHLRANLFLLGGTLLLCSVAYPCVLWAVGQTVFPDQAEGSLVRDTDGKVRGSRLIGQTFNGAEYFQPRPSAAGTGYDAAASGASNWAASNPLLRDRVARQLGPIVQYAANSPTKPGQPVGPDIEAWFTQQGADYPLNWAKEHPTLATQWVKDNADAVANFLGQDAKTVKDQASDTAVPFFEAFVNKPENKGAWPTSGESKQGEQTVKVIVPVKQGEAIQAYFFDAWLSAHRDNAEIVLEKVPADAVMASGSGLDPHITLANARSQVGRIAAEWAKRTGAPQTEVVAALEKLLQESQFAPMYGLFGEPLINVLEVNLALPHRLQGFPKAKS